MKAACALALCFLTLAGFAGLEPAAAQSAFAARGLGFPIEPVDARARGLGGIALGLPEPEISWINPAGAIGLVDPGMLIAYQYDNFTAEVPGSTAEGGTARFPLLLAAFPVSERLVLSAGYGGFLDQNWRVERPDSLILDNDTIQVTDLSSSEGSVARLRAAVAYEIIESLGLGLALDVYTGEVERVRGRLFEQQTTPQCCRALWNYGGLGYTVGARWIPSEATGVGASLSYGGTLEASLTEGAGDEASYSLPLLLRAGASARVGQNTLVALGGSWSGWSTLDEALRLEGGARDSWSAEAGIEWDAIVIRERPVPLRIGARTAALPFRWGIEDEADWVDERALTLGGGVLLAGGAARSDLAVEFGGRGGDGSAFDESFWRFSFSVRVVAR